MSTAQTIYTTCKHSLALLVSECTKQGLKTYNKPLRTTEYMFTDGSYILISAGKISAYESK